MAEPVRTRIGRAAAFSFYFVCCGYFLGTLTLTGPVRWTVRYARAAGWSQGAEKAAVILLIGALAASAVLLARLLTSRTGPGAGKAARRGLPALSLALFLGSLALWLNPRFMAGTGLGSPAELFSWSEFVFGPYPEKPRLAELKAEGYTGVISLLSPAVLPFEPILLAREQAAARETGIELIHIPMLPWVSENGHVAGRLKELNRRGPGKYYVHCYLGKDRVNVFKTILGMTLGSAAAGAAGPAPRSLADRESFERGAITKLGPDAYFTPYPTDEEFFAYILNGTIRTQVSLLDPGNPEDLPWIEKERAIAEKYGLRFENHPWKALDPAARAEAVKRIKKLEKPLVVHAFLSHAPECEEFVAAYRGR